MITGMVYKINCTYTDHKLHYSNVKNAKIIELKARETTCSSTFMCFENSFTAWHSLVIERKPLQWHFIIMYFCDLSPIIQIIFHFRCKEKVPYLRSSIDLKAEVLIIRTAGLPGSSFPSTTCPSHNSFFHCVPKASFICLPKVSASWSKLLDILTIHDSEKL